MNHNGKAFVWGVLVSSVVGVVSFPAAIMAQNPPTLEQQRAQDAERTRQVQSERQLERRYDDRDRPGELYVAGFGGYTIGHGFDNVEGTGALSGINLGDIDLKNSGVYGAKVGYFLPRRLNWLGLEMEAFNTTPHLKETAFTTGAHLRVTTLAFNAIARAKMMCERHDDHDRPGRPTIDRDYRDHEFCRLQPYAGVGLGVFFARASDATGSSSDNAVPGLNALAGVRYFLTERVALFGEYKYTRATFDFDNAVATAAGIKGDYSASHIVGGLSLHF
jgi:opacity protein-like surface antigen